MKKILIGVGALAIIGAGFYFYTKNKTESSTDKADKPEELDKTKEADIKSDSNSSSSTTLSSNTTAPKRNVEYPNKPIEIKSSPSSTSSSTQASNPTKKVIRKENRAIKKAYKSTCGRRPLLKRNRAKWQACVNKERASMYSSFEGYDLTDLNNFDL